MCYVLTQTLFSKQIVAKHKRNERFENLGCRRGVLGHQNRHSHVKNFLIVGRQLSMVVSLGYLVLDKDEFMSCILEL